MRNALIWACQWSKGRSKTGNWPQSHRKRAAWLLMFSLYEHMNLHELRYGMIFNFGYLICDMWYDLIINIWYDLLDWKLGRLCIYIYIYIFYYIHSTICLHFSALKLWPQNDFKRHLLFGSWCRRPDGPTLTCNFHNSELQTQRQGKMEEGLIRMCLLKEDTVKRSNLNAETDFTDLQCLLLWVFSPFFLKKYILWILPFLPKKKRQWKIPSRL